VQVQFTETVWDNVSLYTVLVAYELVDPTEPQEEDS
jgi:hypothetical protein